MVEQGVGSIFLPETDPNYPISYKSRCLRVRVALICPKWHSVMRSPYVLLQHFF